MQRELVERAQAGDHEAFSVLVRGSFDRVLGIARLVLRDPDRAQDAVQEALVLSWKHIRALRDADAWDAWLYRLTIRACYRSARQVRQRDRVELHVMPDVKASTEGDFSMTVVERDRLLRELDRLPIEQRTLVVLRFYADLSLPEAAAILGIPLGTAKSRLHRGLATLRVGLSAERPSAASRARSA
jgi:RNA polymerase sigma-70 factor, ECF subfamily